MLTKRIIPCLDIKNGRTVKGTNFVQLRDAGDPVELAYRYSQEGADELVFLDIGATIENRTTLISLVESVGRVVNIPFAVGGGICDEKIVYSLLQAGADKVSVNSSALQNPDLITNISKQYGEQCVIIAIDARFVNDDWYVYSHGGTRSTGILLDHWATEALDRGAGEVLFTSMDHDGTEKGFATEKLYQLNRKLSIPVIASGGAGTMQHFCDVFKYSEVSAALAASVFHFQRIKIPALKTYLYAEDIPIRL